MSMSHARFRSPIESFWEAYLATQPENSPLRRQPIPPAWGFGSTQEMADELGKLVQEGVKTATCSLLWEHESDGEPLPQVGALSIVLDGDDYPLCLIETVEVEIRPFNEVDARFAHDEGEGDRSLNYWREVHLRFFAPICQKLGMALDDRMPLVCERFRLVYRW
jgi:uncharacterized protein YhfF